MKSMFTAAEFVNQCGEKALAVIQEMESYGKLTGYVFKCMESLVVPDDWVKVARMLLVPGIKASVTKLREISVIVSRQRWWTWCLMHPELDSQYIHPSRSVFPFLPAALSLVLAVGYWL